MTVSSRREQRFPIELFIAVQTNTKILKKQHNNTLQNEGDDEVIPILPNPAFYAVFQHFRQIKNYLRIVLSRFEVLDRHTFVRKFHSAGIRGRPHCQTAPYTSIAPHHSPADRPPTHNRRGREYGRTLRIETVVFDCSRSISALQNHGRSLTGLISAPILPVLMLLLFSEICISSSL